MTEFAAARIRDADRVEVCDRREQDGSVCFARLARSTDQALRLTICLLGKAFIESQAQEEVPRARRRRKEFPVLSRQVALSASCPRPRRGQVASEMALLFLANAFSALALSLKTSSFRGLDGIESSSRYFTSKLVAPPLDRILGSAMPPFECIDSRPLDVLYTNDPHTVALWISENIASRGWTTIGFDTEVRTPCVDRTPT